MSGQYRLPYANHNSGTTLKTSLQRTQKKAKTRGGEVSTTCVGTGKCSVQGREANSQRNRCISFYSSATPPSQCCAVVSSSVCVSLPFHIGRENVAYSWESIQACVCMSVSVFSERICVRFSGLVWVRVRIFQRLKPLYQHFLSFPFFQKPRKKSYFFWLLKSCVQVSD